MNRYSFPVYISSVPLNIDVSMIFLNSSTLTDPIPIVLRMFYVNEKINYSILAKKAIKLRTNLYPALFYNDDGVLIFVPNRNIVDGSLSDIYPHKNIFLLQEGVLNDVVIF